MFEPHVAPFQLVFYKVVPETAWGYATPACKVHLHTFGGQSSLRLLSAHSPAPLGIIRASSHSHRQTASLNDPLHRYRVIGATLASTIVT